MKVCLLFFVLILFVSCSKRNRDNPFDSTGDQPVNLYGHSLNKSVQLSWDLPNLVDYTGFNLYREEQDVDETFTRVAELAPTATSYTDLTVEFGFTYNYFIKVAAGNLESRSSNEISVTPGPGYNWIIDETSYKVVKTSYDLSYTLLVYDTYPDRPTDMAVSSHLNTGVILFTRSGLIQEINLSGNLNMQHREIQYPYAIAYDPVSTLFWIADSSGVLYTLDTGNHSIIPIYSSLSKPISLNIAAQQNIISIVDISEKEIVQFNRAGYLIDKISLINGKSLQGPTHFIFDENHNRIWLVDGNSNFDYIYTKLSEDENYFLADSVLNCGDIDISLSSDLAWYVSLNSNRSSVLQLSPDGTRLFELTYFYNPFDLQVNPYDGSLLVVDSWSGRVLHYDNSNRIIGIMKNLIFPVKVVVQ